MGSCHPTPTYPQFPENSGSHFHFFHHCEWLQLLTTAGLLMPQPLVPLLPNIWWPVYASQSQVLSQSLLSSVTDPVPKLLFQNLLFLHPFLYYFSSLLVLMSLCCSSWTRKTNCFIHYVLTMHSCLPVLAGHVPCPWDCVSSIVFNHTNVIADVFH